MPVNGTAPRPAAAPPLIERLRAAGLVAPRTTVREAERAGLPLALACALLEKESSGGRNVFGHDPTIFAGAGKVTRANYADYKRRRIASGNRLMQGVGPCQLTWWELQDAADAEGGCWHPEINMRVGFRHLATLVGRYGRSDGARRYNGSGAAAEAYSRDLMVKARRWEQVIGAPAARPAAAGDPGDPGSGRAHPPWPRPARACARWLRTCAGARTTRPPPGARWSPRAIAAAGGCSPRRPSATATRRRGWPSCSRRSPASRASSARSSRSPSTAAPRRRRPSGAAPRRAASRPPQPRSCASSRRSTPAGGSCRTS